MSEASLAAGQRRGPGAILTTPGRVRIFFFGLVWLVWEIVAQSKLLVPEVFVTTATLLRGFFDVVTSATLYQHLGYTLTTCLAGFVLAVAAGTLIGIALGASRLFGDALMPYVAAIASSPKIIFLPVVMAFTGFGPDSNVTMAFIGALFPVLIAAYAGMLSINPVHVRVARSFNINTPQMVWKVYLPSVRGSLLVGSRLAFGGALVSTVLSEAKFGQDGLGYLTLQYYSAFNIPKMFSVLIVLFAVAIVLNSILDRFAARIPH